MSKNESRFVHSGPNGTEVTATRCDLNGGVVVKVSPHLSLEKLMQDIGAIMAFHAVNIRPDLNGFNGYDTVQYTIEH